MSNHVGGLMAVAITRDEARVWTSAEEPGVVPESIHAPSEMSRHHHVREAQHHHGHDTDHDNPVYYESITQAVDGASRILLVGHGRGKANEMVHLTQYWERKHPDVARKVVGAVDSDLDALTDNEVLALVRNWFEEYREFI
jgi:hypothetical protein